MLHITRMTTSITEAQKPPHGTRIPEYLSANSYLYRAEPEETQEDSSSNMNTAIRSSRSYSGHFIFWQSGLHRCFGTGFRISKINAERQASRTIRLRSKKQPILLLHYPIKERSETHIKKPKLRIMKLRLAAPCSVLFKNEVISPVPFRSQDPF